MWTARSFRQRRIRPSSDHFYLSKNLPCFSSAGPKWNKPIGRAVATARVCDHHLSARGVSYITNRHSLIYSSWIRSDFIWYIHWIKTQMLFHRKLRALVLIYKPMAQIFTVQPAQLERFSVTFYRSIQKQLQCCKTICLTQLRTACWASKD